MDISPILIKIKEALVNIEPEVKVYLYGSYARGEAREDSDIDILVLLGREYERMEFIKKWGDVSAALYDISLENSVDISPFTITAKEFYSRRTPFSINVINDRIEI